MRTNTDRGITDALARDIDLTKTEVEKLSALLENEEKAIERYFYYKQGGWADAEVYDYDEDIICIEVKHGRQQGKTTYSEYLKIDRHTMEWIN